MTFSKTKTKSILLMLFIMYIWYNYYSHIKGLHIGNDVDIHVVLKLTKKYRRLKEITMKESITEKLSLFTTNAQAMKGSFKLQETLTKQLAAMLYTFENKQMDCNAIKQCHTLIKDSTGIFSSFRGNMSLCVSAMLSLQDAPDQLLTDTLIVYDLLKNAKFRASDYLTVAALLIASNTDTQGCQHTVERAKAFYDEMKKSHWFITGEDDYIFAVMLGLSDIDPISGTERIEQLYQRLKPEFKSKAGGNAVQALSQILVLGGKSDEALDHIFTLNNALRDQKIKLDKTYTLPALGVLALLPIDGDILANDILEAQAYLRAQKGFGSLSISTQELLLFSTAIVTSVYAEEMKNDIVTASITTSIIGIIIAMQMAIIIMSTAAVTAASTSSSN